MKKIILTMAIAALALGACDSLNEPLTIDNSLTPDEISAKILTPEVMWKMSRIGSSSLSPDAKSVLYTQTDYSMAENRGVTTIWVEDIATKTPTRLTDLSSSSVSPQWSSDGSQIYFLSPRSGSMQIWRMNSDGGNALQLSNVEGGIEGYGIAPNEEAVWYVASVKVEKRASSEIYEDMDKSKARIYDDLMVRHWDAWDDGSHLHIFVAQMDNKKIGEGKDIIGADAPYDTPLSPYFSMGEIAWNNSSSAIAYTCKPLTGAEYAQSTDSDIYIYDLQSDKTTNICKGAKVDGVLTNLHGYDKYPVFSPNDKMLAFSSQRRAGNESDKSRLFVYSFESGTMRDLTKSFDYNAQNVVWQGEDMVWFISPIRATHQICRVPASGGVVKVVTEGKHDINSFTMVGDCVVAELTKLTMATELFTVDIKNGDLKQISFVNEHIYDKIPMGEVREYMVPTTDNKEMLTWVVLPPDFDENKKYPVLLYCQGGPQSVVSQFWSYRWNFQLMAAQGYIVVAPNRRGLPSFGQEWLDQISGDYSGQNIRDYLSAVDFVAKEKWADEERMGCVGASYGGYSVYYLAGHHDKRFKAFISHCGIFNFESMYGHTEELFFVNNDYGGAYWDKDNATAQRSYANSPHKFVESWDTPMLIITGEYDYRIPYSQSLEAFTAARLQGLPSRLVSFENEAHQVFKPQNSLVWNREFFGWLDKYVK